MCGFIFLPHPHHPPPPYHAGRPPSGKVNHTIPDSRLDIPESPSDSGSLILRRNRPREGEELAEPPLSLGGAEEEKETSSGRVGL